LIVVRLGVLVKQPKNLSR